MYACLSRSLEHHTGNSMFLAQFHPKFEVEHAGGCQGTHLSFLSTNVRKGLAARWLFKSTTMRQTTPGLETRIGPISDGRSRKKIVNEKYIKNLKSAYDLVYREHLLNYQILVSIQICLDGLRASSGNETVDLATPADIQNTRF
ncbi:hypothetical protein TNCV_1525811 [Trichonephila clavipes]|nr:hypothetical protein TNCV_1525811 [Trichonephila clavipes]